MLNQRLLLYIYVQVTSKCWVLQQVDSDGGGMILINCIQMNAEVLFSSYAFISIIKDVILYAEDSVSNLRWKQLYIKRKSSLISKGKIKCSVLTSLEPSL